MSIFESWKKKARTYLPFEVFDYDTGRLLPGQPSEELIKKSFEAGPEGAVSAYIDDNKVWQYIPSSQKQHYKENLQEIVKTVFVIKD